MSDRKLRELERLAAGGDAEAAERLYWENMRLYTGPQLMDRLIEAVVTMQTKKAPTVQQKLAFLQGLPVEQKTEVQIGRLRKQWSQIDDAADLHRVPRDVRQAGFTTYCSGDMGVYRVEPGGEWKRVAQLSADPPGFPVHVVQTLAQRDALSVGRGSEACLVLANRGVYRSEVVKNAYSEATVVRWESIRFEKGGGQ